MKYLTTSSTSSSLSAFIIRLLIMKAERDELVEEVVRYFIEGKGL